MLPRVAIVPSPEFAGINNLQGEASFMDVLPFEEAFFDPHETDVHFVAYSVRGEASWPRLNKPVLPKIHAAGGDVVTTMLVFDYDNPDHTPWTEELYRLFVDRLFALDEEGFDLALGWTLFYTTRHGARFVYVLSEPVLVDEAEGLHRGVVREFKHAGIALDEKCSDWTRLFRAPFVVRGKTPTWEDDFFEEIQQLDNRLDPKSIVPGAAPATSTYADIEELDIAQPDIDAAIALLRDINPGTGREITSDWYKRARRQLKNRRCYPCLFEHAALAAPGDRDNAIQRLVGEAVSLLYYLEGSSPQLVYALFLDALLQLEPDEDTPDWSLIGWKAVLRWWAREEAKDTARREEQDTTGEMAASLTDRVLAGMREWCDNPTLRGEYTEAVCWLMEHLIVSTPVNYYVMTPSGTYDAVGVTAKQLAIRIRELGMDPLIPLETPREDGKGYKKRLLQHIVDDHATVANTVEGAVGVPGTIIRNIGEDDAVLVLRLYGRKKMAPKFDNEVDQWLRRLGGKQYQRLLDWIALALDFEAGPICALSLAGPPGCGKKLLTQGLAECINTEAVADGKEFGRFQSGLLRTPFLTINEGVPTMGTSLARDPADTFRHLVSGDPLLVEQKFKDPVLVRNPVRVLFAANNLDVVQVLTGHRDLSPDDREALAIRLFHLDVPAEASTWLRLKGGLLFTGRPGRRWIRGDDGSPSNYIVAKHFLWLYANARPAVPLGNRLLMEGEMDGELIRLMSTRSGAAPDVIEALIRMIETHTAVDGLHIDDGRIYVTTSAIVDYHRRSIGQKTNRQINSRSVGKVLKGLVVKGSSTRPRPLDTGKGKRVARWREIEARLLLEEAVEHGYACARLSKIVAGQDLAELPVKEEVTE